MEKEIEEYLISLGDKSVKETLSWFFKTAKGEYGEGDLFLGIKIPPLREAAKKYYKKLSLIETENLLQNKYHEIRSFAIFVLVLKYNEEPQEVFNLYLRNLKYINNWDLVDQSASYIVGNYLFSKNRELIYQLSDSSNMWERRIAIISTHYFIKNNEFNDTLALAKKYLKTKDDLIKKATGWMLREVGKKDYDLLIKFLKDHLKEIPSITFSYAIERLEEADKKRLKELRKK